MSDVCTFQVIRLDGPNVPLRVLEEGLIPKETATLEFARELLQDRCKGPSYRVQAGLSLRPEGVRMLDSNGGEMLRYTVIDLRRDGGQITPDESN